MAPRAEYFMHRDPPGTGLAVKSVLLRSADGKTLWRRHPTREVDLALLKLPQGEANGCMIRPFSKESLPPENFEFLPGDPVTLVGFPLGGGDLHNNLPFFRGGSLGTLYGTHYLGHHAFLVDIRSNDGMSGAPAITRKKPREAVQSRNGSPPSDYYLLGINSGAALVPDRSNPSAPEPKYVRIGFNHIWYASLVEEIAATFE